MSGVGARDSFAKGGSQDVLQEALIEVLGVDLRIETMVDPGHGGTGRAPAEPVDVAPPTAHAAAPFGESSGAPAAPRSAASPSSAPGPIDQPDVESPGPVAAEARSQARQQVRPTRRAVPGDPSAVDDRDAAADRSDADLDSSDESTTELLARQLGAEIIAEEERAT
jgi:DNA polymerase-3 subunit gamma/tau